VSDGERRTVRGYSLWWEDREGIAVELTSKTHIELDDERCRWHVSSPAGNGGGKLVESGSRDVREFINDILTAMNREARRSTVRPGPEPVRKPQCRVPSNAPVPCPLCIGEAWPDCECCDGEGVVSPQCAAAWPEKNR
jgi:hypothetical protein